MVELILGRSLRILRPVGDDSIASRSLYMKYGVAVASPRAAIKSVYILTATPIIEIKNRQLL